MKRLLLLLVLLAASPALRAADLVWQFVRVGQTHDRGPMWSTSTGTATVQIHGRSIRIETFVVVDSHEPELVFEGRIDAHGRITARCTQMGTDASPYQVQGRLRTWQQEDVWGGKPKIVTERQIEFAGTPIHEMYGFVVQEVRDK